MRILIVCMWPLGGIRTYLKYNYAHFPRDQFEITMLANSTAEDEALKKDMQTLGIRVVWTWPLMKRNVLFLDTLRMLMAENFDLIHSQGFGSAFHVSLANKLFCKPHVLTIHGILEEKRFAGAYGRLKRFLFRKIIRNVTVFNAVGEDILNHTREALSQPDFEATRWVVINNGINPQPFLEESPDAKTHLCRNLGIDQATFVFGFFGRFMPEKGFGYIVEAVDILSREHGINKEFVVMAVGSGDFELRDKSAVAGKDLSSHFRFLPFTPNIAEYMKGCDAVVMPSVWEAFPLLSSEVLCCGVPLIATNCSGLREAVSNSPALVIPAENSEALAQAMNEAMADPDLKKPFVEFRPIAGKRFDAKDSAAKLVELFKNLLEGRTARVGTVKGAGNRDLHN